ncbi:cobyric acid synthase CobQ [Truepera radiovictrix DSM 17093]|uniref:Cobyric acid synthase n=2 Tax=Truepera TaxID=332248 RepID=D7CRM5_TRURR|nr:cobyric acid synthase CobQ [Truepera radiovictrix DSM 17093]
MVQGCSSGAGKSYLTAALCRLYARRGVRVAPFKAQNMSNNAGVTPDGLEMSRAQLVQARAARVVPDVRMNPVLLKPEGDRRSQVVLLGRADPALSRLPWEARKARLWPHVAASLRGLLEAFELVILEGAGSPAEVNLKAGDIVNMRAALEADAKVLLVADIDRGGAFAHLLGTWACLEAAERETLLGFVLNKFRGDPALLGDATAWLAARTGRPTLGVVPYLPLALPEEDAQDLPPAGAAAREAPVRVAALRFPTVSNFDEFGPLARHPAVALSWVEAPSALAAADLIVLPGSKHLTTDAAWLQRTGLGAAVQERAESGALVLGICGGMQLLGRVIHDPHGLEGAAGTVTGLGLLDLETTLAPIKVTRNVQSTLLATGETVTGYEIHHGRTRAGGRAQPLLADGLGFRQGRVLGVYPHGLLEDAAFVRYLLGALGVSAAQLDPEAGLEAALDRLADHVEAHLDVSAIDDALFRGRAPRRPPRLVLVTGGARSGKSRYAEALVRRFLEPGEGALYLATLRASDPEMARRVARHRARRPVSWRTLETPLAPAEALAAAPERVVLLDCLSGYVANLLLSRYAAGEQSEAEAAAQAGDEAIAAALAGVDALLGAVRRAGKTVVVVTNEVGSGVVPAYALGRLFRDALGLANARVAAAADAVALCVVGLPQLLKGTLPEVTLDEGDA